MSKFNINTRGDTIVEVLIALAILSLAMSITYATVNSSINGLAIARSTSRATALMQQQAELLRIADISRVRTLYFCITSETNPPEVVFSPDRNMKCKTDNTTVSIKQTELTSSKYVITANWSIGGKNYSSSMVYEL